MEAYTGCSSTKQQYKNIRMEDIQAMLIFLYSTDKGYSSTKNNSSASLAERIRKMYRNQAGAPQGSCTNANNLSNTGNSVSGNNGQNLNNSGMNNIGSKGNLKDLLDNFYKRNSKSPQSNNNPTSQNILLANNNITNSQMILMNQQLQHQNNVNKMIERTGAKASEGLKNYVTNIIMKKMSKEDLKNNQENIQYASINNINNCSNSFQKKKSHSISNKYQAGSIVNQSAYNQTTGVSTQPSAQRYAYSNQRPSQKLNDPELSILNKTIGNSNLNNQSSQQSYSPCTKAALQYHQQQVQYSKEPLQHQYLQQQLIVQPTNPKNNQFKDIRGIDSIKSPSNQQQSLQKKRQKTIPNKENTYGNENLNFTQLNNSSNAYTSSTQQQFNILNSSSNQLNTPTNNNLSYNNSNVQPNNNKYREINTKLNSSSEFLKNYQKMTREKSSEICTDQSKEIISYNQQIQPQNSKRALSHGLKQNIMNQNCLQTSQNYNPSGVILNTNSSNLSHTFLNTSHQITNGNNNSSSNILLNQNMNGNNPTSPLNSSHQKNMNNNLSMYYKQQIQQTNKPNLIQQLHQQNQQQNQQNQQQQIQQINNPSFQLIKISSTKENKKIEFPSYINNQILTCDNKRKQNEHFQFDFPSTTTNATGIKFSNNTQSSIQNNNYNQSIPTQTNGNNLSSSGLKNYDPQQITTTVTNTQVYDCEENTTTAKKQKPSNEQSANQPTTQNSQQGVSSTQNDSNPTNVPYNPFLNNGTPKDHADNIRFLMDDSKCYEPDKFLSAIPEEKDKKIIQFIDNDKIDKTQKFKEEYLVGKQVGQGAYATVRVALNKIFNKKVAIKIYEKQRIKEPQRKKSVRREIKLLQMLNHLNVIKVYDTVETNNHVNIIMEYIPGTSLHGYLKSQQNRRLTDNEAKRIFKQIMSSIEYIHSKQICHRDIKLENILLDENNNPKLIDFGFSTCIPNDQKYKMFCGTPSYMAPEIVNKKEYTGPPADIWALGVLLYALLCGTFPFKDEYNFQFHQKGQTDKELYKKITKGDFSSPEFLSKESRDFIKWILNVNCDERPSATDVLNHAWLGGKRSSFIQNQGQNQVQQLQITQQINPSKIQQQNAINNNTTQGQNTYNNEAGAQQQQQQQQQQLLNSTNGGSSATSSSTILVNNYLQINSPFNQNLKQFKFNNPQRTPSGQSSNQVQNGNNSQNNNLNTSNNVNNNIQNNFVNNYEKDSYPQKSIEKDKFMSPNNVFYYPNKNNQTPQSTSNQNQNNNYFINNKNIVIQLNNDGNSPTSKPPLPLTVKSSSSNYQNYFVSNNQLNQNNNANNNNNTFSDSPNNYNSTYHNLQKRHEKRMELFRHSQDYVQQTGDCTYISDKNNLSSNNMNINPYVHPSQHLNTQSSNHNMNITANTHSAQNFALHHLNEDEPINSIDSDVLKSIVYMGYANDEETIINEIKDPKNPLSNLYKKIYNKKVHQNKTIYPSHIPATSFISSLGSVKSPQSSSINNMSCNRGQKKIINFGNSYNQEQNTFNQSYNNNINPLSTKNMMASSSANNNNTNNILNSGSFLNSTSNNVLNNTTLNKLYDQDGINAQNIQQQHFY